MVKAASFHLGSTAANAHYGIAQYGIAHGVIAPCGKGAPVQAAEVSEPARVPAWNLTVTRAPP
jgi:hypothetical protein